jgi:hypothetical protein
MSKLKSNVLEVGINGKHVGALGLRRHGNCSVIVSMFSQGQKPARKPLQSISSGSLERDTKDTFYFFDYLKRTTLKVGDVVTISVRESGKVPRIKPKYKETKRIREKRHAAYIARENRAKEQPAN